MNQLEQELRKALVRTEPADDFTERVLTKTRDLQTQRIPARWFAANLWQRAAIAALVTLLFVAGFGYRQHTRRVKGEEAKEQLLMALQIARTQLRVAQMRVEGIDNSGAIRQ